MPQKFKITPEFFFETSSATVTIDKTHINTNNLANLAKKNGMFLKEEFHFTVIGFKTGGLIQKKIERKDDFEKKTFLEIIESLLFSIKWDVIFKDEYYLVEKTYKNQLNPQLPEKRKSIIQIVEIKGIQEFYLQLKDIVNIDFELPFSHITLYTNSTLPENKLSGIGIYSENDFRALSPKKI